MMCANPYGYQDRDECAEECPEECGESDPREE